MPRYYVRNPKTGRWNIYSTIVDDFILDEWATFDDLKHYAVSKEKTLRALKRAIQGLMLCRLMRPWRLENTNITNKRFEHHKKDNKLPSISYCKKSVTIS